MTTRSKLAALGAAGALALGAAGMVLAAPPAYGVSLTIGANPTTVPSGGGSVDFTVHVQATSGTGDLLTVNVSTDVAGCTLSAPTGDDGDSKLEDGETWTYTCTATGVAPNTTANATVYACHANGGTCDAGSHDATSTNSTLVGLSAATATPTLPPTLPPGATPTAAVGGASDAASQPNTAAISASSDANGGSAVVIAILGLAIASLLILKPAKVTRRR
jgi:hypothetical protein